MLTPRRSRTADRTLPIAAINLSAGRFRPKPKERPVKPILARLVAAVSTLSSPRSQTAAKGRYDRLIDATNRLPRPVLVFGTLALFALALIDPAAFDRAMDSLRRMPDELWWLVAAILAGHFGAREAHHLRERPSQRPEKPASTQPDSPS